MHPWSPALRPPLALPGGPVPLCPQPAPLDLSRQLADQHAGDRRSSVRMSARHVKMQNVLAQAQDFPDWFDPGAPRNVASHHALQSYDQLVTGRHLGEALCYTCRDLRPARLRARTCMRVHRVLCTGGRCLPLAGGCKQGPVRPLKRCPHHTWCPPSLFLCSVSLSTSHSREAFAKPSSIPLDTEITAALVQL
jgi:hypothetical protein